MKITMVDPGNFSPLYNANLCHCLGARGHEVQLDTSQYLFEPIQPLADYRVRNQFFGLVSRIEPLERWKLVRQAVKAAVYPIDLARWAAGAMSMPPDVVHVQWSLLPLLDSRVYAYLQRRGSRVVYTVHDVRPLPGSAWSAAGFAHLYRVADAVIVHAEESRRQLIEDVGVARERVHVLPMGGPGAYAGQAPSRREAREQLGLDAQSPCVLFFGLIKEHKGLDVLLDALALARRDRPELRLLLAGQPLTSWRPYARQIATLGLGHSIDLHLGFVPSDRVAAYFRAADLVVVPYREIFQSGVILAAYTFERPVVATRVGGLPEVVQDGVTGFLVSPGDAPALADVLVDATADPGRLDAMGVAASALARGPHSWEHIAACHEEVYVAAMRGNGPQGLKSA